MIAVRVLALCILAGVLSSGLHLDVVIHYPEKQSTVEFCGFTFLATTSFTDPAAAVRAVRTGQDTFTARVDLHEDRVYEKATVGVLADTSSSNLMGSVQCQRLCPRMGSQGQAMQFGAFLETEPLLTENSVDVWPAFCRSQVGEVNASFYSSAIGREVNLVARLPAASLENYLPRPARYIPPVMFRLNSEWYWPHSRQHYSTWHDLMVSGEMEFFAVVEIYIEGVDWSSWDTQPMYTVEKLRYSCGQCDPSLQFVCDSWESSAYFVYRGGNHSFGHAEHFFDELYDDGLPQVLQHLPHRLDSSPLRVGVWGYCIGGLAAWTAVTTRPKRFNIAYMGSPAMDFDCGEPFRAITNVTWDAVRPRIYIDSGAAEGQIMNRMAFRLFRLLEDKGLVEGRDVFYTRAQFGTHQANAFLRRSLKGLLLLFGAGSCGRDVYTSVMRQSPIIVQPDSMSMGGQWFSGFLLFALNHGWSSIFVVMAIILAFMMGRLSTMRNWTTSAYARESLLALEPPARQEWRYLGS